MKLPLIRMFFAFINNKDFNYSQNINNFCSATMETTVENIFLIIMYKLKPELLESSLSVLIPLLLDPLN